MNVNVSNEFNFSDVYRSIFTLASNFHKWTYFGPTRFILPWKTLIHVTFCVSDVTDKSNIWLANVMFDWRHVMVTAVERNNQTCRIVTFLCHLFARYFHEPQKNWIYFLNKLHWVASKVSMNRKGSFTLHVTQCRLNFDKHRKNEILSLNIILATDFPLMNLSGPTGFIHRWTSVDHVTLSWGDITDNRTSWLVNVTFRWRLIMTTAV